SVPPAVRRTAAAPVKLEETPVESFFPAGQRPIGKPLIAERCAIADEDGMDQPVAVFATQVAQQVAMPAPAPRRRGRRGKTLHSIAADAPQHLQCESFPFGERIAPVLDRRIAK